MNKVILNGRITSDPEVKTTQSGTSVVQFTVAVDRSYAGKDGEKKSDFIRCVAWRGTADFIGKYFKKGKPIVLDGTLQTRQYTDKDGNKREATEVLVENVEFTISDRTDNGGAAPAAKPKAAASAEPAPAATTPDDEFDVTDDDDDLPF